MDGIVTYELDGRIATITMDDGKVNALSLQMLDELGRALDRAVGDGAVVLLCGRDRMFSAGFDLAVLTAGGTDAIAMLDAGFALAERLLSFPTPVVIVCPGPAIAMGVFLLLSADYRIGVEGTARITANEVAIGMVLPRGAIEICRHRLTPAAFERAVGLAEVFDAESAMAAGFLDRVVAPSELHEAARGEAERLAALDPAAHTASKLRARSEFLRVLRTARELDAADLSGGR